MVRRPWTTQPGTFERRRSPVGGGADSSPYPGVIRSMMKVTEGDAYAARVNPILRKAWPSHERKRV